MHDDDSQDEDFEETVREIARELGRSVERALEQIDFEEVAGMFGVDLDRAREWVDSAEGWLRGKVEGFGEDAIFNATRKYKEAAREEQPVRDDVPATEVGPGHEDPLRSAGPHPLDLPTEEQGTALAALESGRWALEPGSNTLAARGEGPKPNDALGLVRELRARDWITGDGEVTVVGRRALTRWLDSVPS